MASLALLEEAVPPPGVPEWIERSLNVKPGRDPIGLQTITLDRIMPILLPGILVLSRRARYFTLFPFLLQTFRDLQLPASNDVLSEFIKLREFEFACAVHLCPNGCGDSSSGAVGSSRAGPAVRRQGADPCECRSRRRTRHEQGCPRTVTGENVSAITPHTLRRTFGSYLVNRGLRLEVVSRLLGHSSTVVTERAYAELLGTTIRDELLAVLADDR